MTEQRESSDGDPSGEIVLKGIALRRAGLIAAAEVQFQSVLSEQPRHADALHQLGLVRTAQADFSGAIPLLRSAVELRPANASWLNDLANALCHGGDLAAGVVHYEKALEINPRFAECHYNLGVALARRSDIGQAVRHYQSAIALDLRAPEVFYNLGVALQELDQPSEAVSNYDKALALRPDYVQAHFNCGNALLQQGKRAEAVQRYEAATGFAPDHVSAHYNLAMTQMQLGRKAEAVLAYRRVLQLCPNHHAAGHVLATLIGENPVRAPAGYVARLFDRYAPGFDSHLVGTLRYDIPSRLARVLVDSLGSAASTADILDLGCGTGLFGAAVRPWCGTLVGVDLSAGMLVVAAQKSIYDRLVEADLFDYLRACAADAFQVIVAADVLCYLGDLAELFEQAKRVCRAGGILAFSIEEDSGSAADYGLRPTGRFAHSAAYVRLLANRLWFAERLAEQVTVRFENGAAVEGRLFVLAKLY